jgi:integrase
LGITFSAMACYVRQPRSPYWTVKFKTANGRPTMRSTKETDLSKARKIGDAWEEAARKARAGELTMAAGVKLLNELLEKTGEKVTITSTKQHFTDWLEQKKVHGKATSTVQRYTPILDGFLAFLGPTRSEANVASVTPTEIERFRTFELQSGKSAGTADYDLKVLRGVFADLHVKGLIPINPAASVKTLRKPSPRKQAFTEAQVRSILQAANNEWRGMVLFGARAGLRLTDASNLSWMSIDLSERTLVIKAKKTSNTESGYEAKTIALHPDIVDWLESQQAGDKPDAPLFPSLVNRKAGGEGENAGGLSNAFKRLMHRAGIAIPLGEEKAGKGRRSSLLSFHSTRHAFVTSLLDADVPKEVRKALSGHSSDEAHERYIHLQIDTQRRAIEKLPSITRGGKA